MSNIVAIVGRPNVGKSTFFNRLIQRREAIVDAVSGVTRDRHYGKSDWNGREFSLIDTGGYVLGSDDVFEAEIDKQVELAIDEADAIIFMVNVEDGITGMDEDVAKLLRKVDKPVFLVVNKVDNGKRAEDAVEFYNLGLGEYFTIASISGSGTGELLDELVKVLPELPEVSEEEALAMKAAREEFAGGRKGKGMGQKAGKRGMKGHGHMGGGRGGQSGKRLVNAFLGEDGLTAGMTWDDLQAKVTEAFNGLDADQSGTLTRDEIMPVMKEMFGDRKGGKRGADTSDA